MKTRLLTLLSVVVITALLMLSGCGSGSKSGGSEAKEPEPFTLGGYTYKLERFGKTSGGYEASLLIEGDSAPVIITNGMTRAGVEMMLASGDKTFNYNEVSFAVLADDESGRFRCQSVVLLQCAGRHR